MTPAHIPELLELAEDWADDDREWPEDDTLYAPIHAWRALGQLGAEEAVAPLLEMMNYLDDQGDDWYLEEFPYVFGMAGPAAIPQLVAYVTDPANNEYPRIAATHGLREVAKYHPEARAQVVQIVTDVLNRHEPSQYALNADYVYDLLELNAVESAEAIERAYSAGVVDEGVCGNWEKVREELGVEGLGLPQPQNPFNSMENFRRMMFDDRQRADAQDRTKKKKKLAARLKQHRKKQQRK